MPRFSACGRGGEEEEEEAARVSAAQREGERERTRQARVAAERSTAARAPRTARTHLQREKLLSLAHCDLIREHLPLQLIFRAAEWGLEQQLRVLSRSLEGVNLEVLLPHRVIVLVFLRLFVLALRRGLALLLLRRRLRRFLLLLLQLLRLVRSELLRGRGRERVIDEPQVNAYRAAHRTLVEWMSSEMVLEANHLQVRPERDLPNAVRVEVELIFVNVLHVRLHREELLESRPPLALPLVRLSAVEFVPHALHVEQRRLELPFRLRE